MEISWTDRVRNEAVLIRVKENGNASHTTEKKEEG